MGNNVGVLLEFNLAAENATVSRKVAWSQVIILANFICLPWGDQEGLGGEHPRQTLFLPTVDDPYEAELLLAELMIPLHFA